MTPKILTQNRLERRDSTNFEDGCEVGDPLAEERRIGVVSSIIGVSPGTFPFPFRTAEQAHRVGAVGLDRLDPLATERRIRKYSPALTRE